MRCCVSKSFWEVCERILRVQTCQGLAESLCSMGRTQSYFRSQGLQRFVSQHTHHAGEASRGEALENPRGKQFTRTVMSSNIEKKSHIKSAYCRLRKMAIKPICKRHKERKIMYMESFYAHILLLASFGSSFKASTEHQH